MTPPPLTPANRMRRLLDAEATVRRLAQQRPAPGTQLARDLMHAMIERDALRIDCIDGGVRAAADVVAGFLVARHAEDKGYNDQGLGFDKWRGDAVAALSATILLDDPALCDDLPEYDEAQEEADARATAAEERAERLEDERWRHGL